MRGDRMTDNEIIKALEKFKDRVYTTMFYYRLSSDERKAIHDVLYLIDRQKAEIERLSRPMFWVQHKPSEKNFSKKTWDEMVGTVGLCHTGETIIKRIDEEGIKSEARKEFAERLKAMHRHNTTSVVSLVTVFDNINKLLAEMESESNA